MEERICRVCEKTKLLSDFGFRNKETGLRHNLCKICQRGESKARYEANPEYYKQKAKLRKQRVLPIYRQRIVEYLLTHPCVDCGESDIVCLEFDHVNGEKVDNISDLIRHDGAWERIAEEISKCEIRCANCHRRRTARQFGHFRLAGLSI